jgi:hypothetical protein
VEGIGLIIVAVVVVSYMAYAAWNLAHPPKTPSGPACSKADRTDCGECPLAEISPAALQAARSRVGSPTQKPQGSCATAPRPTK